MSGYPDRPRRRFDDCPTCNGWRWIGSQSEWIRVRETVGMVCPTCNTDYSTADKDQSNDH